MTGRKVLVFVSTLVFVSLATLSAQSTDFEVTTAVVTTQIENRVPETQTTDNRFPATVDKLFYFTQIEEAAAPTTILHEWYWEGKLLASVPLAVNAERWRTWSSKTIMPHQTGNWTVVSKRPDGSTAQTTSSGHPTRPFVLLCPPRPLREMLRARPSEDSQAGRLL